jgi:hypothetical protein
MSLEIVLQRLQDNKINAGLQSFCFCGLTVWIGDPITRKMIEGSLGQNESGWRKAGSLGQWLHDGALRLYPDSDYARLYGAPR